MPGQFDSPPAKKMRTVAEQEEAKVGEAAGVINPLDPPPRSTISLKENVESVYEYMRVLASHQVNPLVVPPEELRKVLVKVKDDMCTNPRLELPEDPNKNIWTYYSIMRISPIVMDDLLLIKTLYPVEKYQNIRILVAKLFTRFIIYRTISGSYAISCQEYKLFSLMPKL